MRAIDELVETELAHRLLAAQPQQQRDAAIAAATAATVSARLVDPLLAEAFEDLLQGRYSSGMQSAVAAVEEWLDEQAWEMQANVDAGTAAPEDYHEAFHRARAAGAVKACFDPDPREALNETVYEAAHAVDGDDRLSQLLQAVLDSCAPGNHWAARELADLFWPHFIKIDGYVLLASHYSPDNLAAWKERRPDSRAAIEDVINHVHLEDICAENTPPQAMLKLGQQLANAWRRTLAATPNGESITVELDDEILTAFSRA